MTIVSLVAAGMGVSIAPASVARLNIPGAVFRPLRSKAWSSVDLWTDDSMRNAVFRPLRSKAWSSVDLWTDDSMRNPAAAHLLAIAKEVFSTSGIKGHENK